MYKFTNRIVPFECLFPIGDVIPEDIDGLKLILEDDLKGPENSYDEIIPNLFIGDEFVATNIKKLQALSITHIINAAQGSSRFHYVDTDPSFYGWKGYQIKFMGLPVSDVSDFQINQFFGMATSFIEDALTYTRNGKVLVHGLEGTSRSATIVLAYLILFRKLTATEAMKLVRSKRNIRPNDGFLKQLCDLEFVLKLRAQNESETDTEDSDSEAEGISGSGQSGERPKSRKAHKLKSRERLGGNNEGLGISGSSAISGSSSISGSSGTDGGVSDGKGGRIRTDADGLKLVEGEDSPSNLRTPSKDGKGGSSPSSKRVTFADKPHHHKHHSPKSPSCKVHPGGKGTPPVTPENRCAIHGCKNRAQDKKEGKKSPSRHSPSCKVHGVSPKRVCAIHGDVSQKVEAKTKDDAVQDAKE